MNVSALESSPIWLEKPRPRFASLHEDREFDVVIIGGGMTGLTAAYLLKQAGQRVAVFEKGRIGQAETGHTTAQLTYVTDIRLTALKDTFGEQAARLVWEGGAAAIDTIEEIVQRESIDCRFSRVPGFLCQALTKDVDETEELKAEAELARSLGFQATFAPEVPIWKRPGIRFSNQALIYPIQYLSGLARAVNGDGCEIHEQSEMTESHDDPLAVVVHGHTVRCQKLIIATHVPLTGLNNLLSATLFQSKLAGYSTYAIGATVPKDSLHQASYWDTDNPYYYLRIDNRMKDDYVIFGGQDHRTGQQDNSTERYERLETLLHEFMPQAEVDHRWSGQVIETNDGLPYIGPVNERQFMATGFSGNGITFGTLAGFLARDWVLGTENPWQDLLRVDRVTVRGGTWDYIKENAQFPYQLLKGFLQRAEGDDVADVPPGTGRIVKLHGKRCAVYRSPEQEVKVCSAICTHLGCVVRWNEAEETWDCPCHGSRFNTAGEVLAGPAETALEKVDPDELVD